MVARRPRLAVAMGGHRPAIRAAEGAEFAGQGSWVVDPAGGTLAVSAGLRRLFGWPRSAAARLGWITAAAHPDDRDALAGWLARACAGDPADEPCSFRVFTRDGAIRTLIARAASVRANGRRRVLGIVYDVGDGAAMPAGPRAEQIFRSMFEHSVCGIFQSTPEGRYIMVNPALARIYGYGSPAELQAALTDIGGQLYVDPLRREDFKREMGANGAVQNFESRVYRRDGRVIWISESCREVRTEGGALLYYEGMVTDVSERRRIEDELREARDAAETAIRVKNDFLATMSHELRTPLNAIIGFSEVMQHELLGPLGLPAYRDYAGMILDSGHRLLGIVSDILDIVRIDSGRLALREEIVEVAELAFAVVGALAPAIDGAGVAVTVEVPADLRVRAEEKRLRQALLALAGNAVKFTPAGGRVTVAGARAADGATRITVRDTGIGMSPEALARAKEPFFQVEGAMSRSRDGSGLGLAIADRLVRLHGGAIDLESRAGEGTVATITLPSERAVALDRT